MAIEAEPLARDVVRDPTAGLGALLDRFVGDLGARYAAPGGEPIGASDGLTAALTARWMLPMGHAGLEVHAAQDLASLARSWGSYDGYGEAQFDFSAPLVVPVDPVAHPLGLSAESVGHTRGPRRALVAPNQAGAIRRIEPREQWRATQDGRLSPYPAALGQAGAVTSSLLRFPDARATMARNAVATAASGDRRAGSSSVTGSGAGKAGPASVRPGQVATVLVADGPGRAWGGHAGAAPAATAAEAMADGVQARHLDGSARTPALWLVPAGTGAADRARLAGSVGVRRGASAGLTLALALTDRLAERGAPTEAGAGWLNPSDVGDLVRPAAPARDLGARAAPDATGARPAVRAARAAAPEAASARPGPASVVRPVRSAAESFLPANLRALGESAGAGPQATSAPWQAPSASGAVWRALGRRAAEPGPARSEGFLRPGLGETPAPFFDAGSPGVLVQQPPRVGAAAEAASGTDRGRAVASRRAPTAPAAADLQPRSAAVVGPAPRAASPLARAVGRGVGAEADPVGAGAPVAHQVAARALAHAAEGVGALLSALPAARDFGAVDADRSGGVVSALLSRLAEARSLRSRLATASADADTRPVWSQAGGGALDATWVRPATPVASVAGEPAAAPERSRAKTTTVPSTAALVPAAAGQGSPARAAPTLASLAVAERSSAAALRALTGSNTLVGAGSQASLTRAGRPMTASLPTALEAPARAESSPDAAPGAQVGAGRRAGLAAAPLATEAFAERFAAERFEVGSPLLAAEAPAPAAGVAFWSTPGTLVVPLNWTLAAADGQQAAQTSPRSRGPSAAPGAQPAASAARLAPAPSLAVAGAPATRTLSAGDPRPSTGDRLGRPAVAAEAASALAPRRAGRAAQAAARFADARLAAPTATATSAARSQGWREVPGALVAAETGATAGQPSDAAARSERAPTAREALGRPPGLATDSAAAPRAGAPRLDALPSLATGLLAAFERADRGLIAERAGAAPGPALAAQVRAEAVARDAAADATGPAGLGGRAAHLDGSPGALVAQPLARREGASGTAEADRSGRPGASRAASSAATPRASRPADEGRPGLTAAAATALTARLQAARSRVFEAAARALTRVVVPTAPTSGRTTPSPASRSAAARAPAWTGEPSGALVAGAPSRARLDRPAGLEGLRAPTPTRRQNVGGTLSGEASLVSRLLGAESQSGGAAELGAWSERPGALVAPGATERSAGAGAGTSAAGSASGSAGSARAAQGARPGRRLGFAPGNLDRALVAFGRAARAEADRGGGGRAGLAAVAAQLGGDGGFADLAGALVQTGGEPTRASGSGASRADAPRVRSSMRLPGSLFADRGPSITLGAHDAGPARVMVATGARAAEQALRSTPGERPERGTETNEEARHRNAEQSEDTLSPEEIERIARDVIARLEKEAEADRDLFGEDFD